MLDISSAAGARKQQLKSQCDKLGKGIEVSSYQLVQTLLAVLPVCDQEARENVFIPESCSSCAAELQVQSHSTLDQLHPLILHLYACCLSVCYISASVR
jgi:hypothetical protein